MATEPAQSREPRPFYWRLLPALAIVAVGVIFLVNNLGYRLEFLYHRNWWAVFILVAAIAPLTHAAELYRARGKFDGEIGHALLGSVAIAMVAMMFLLNLDWGVWWPLFVILGGLYTLVPHRYRRRCSQRNWYGEPDDNEPSIKH